MSPQLGTPSPVAPVNVDPSNFAPSNCTPVWMYASSQLVPVRVASSKTVVGAVF